jgi:hypothetical protein
MSWYRPSLEKLSQVAFLAMCIAVTAVAVQRLAVARSVRPDSAPPPIAEGTRLALHSNLQPGTAKASLVLALSTNCQFCTQSMGFYRRLAELDVVRDGSLSLGVASIQPPDQMREYLSTHRLAIASMAQLRESGVSIQGTPTLVLVGADGLVRKSWGGQLSSDGEQDVIKMARAAVAR